MPSTNHEHPLLLLRDSPSAAASLVRDALGIELGDLVVASSTSFAEITPSTYAADLVLSRDLATAVVEVQLARDAKKRRSWPLYLASAHAMHDKPAWLVVIALDPRVAAWARQPIETFHGGALTPRGKLFADAVMHALSKAAREALEAKMKAQGYQYQSEWARKLVAQGLEEGLEQGREEGRRTAIRFACEVLGIECTDEHEQAVAALDAAQLDALHETIKRERRWPE